MKTIEDLTDAWHTRLLAEGTVNVLGEATAYQPLHILLREAYQLGILAGVGFEKNDRALADAITTVEHGDIVRGKRRLPSSQQEVLKLIAEAIMYVESLETSLEGALSLLRHIADSDMEANR